MRRRNRKFVGVAVTLAFVIVWALSAMMITQAHFFDGAPGPLQWICYATLGMGWILPMMPLIRWMERPDPASSDDAAAPVP